VSRERAGRQVLHTRMILFLMADPRGVAVLDSRSSADIPDGRDDRNSRTYAST
jgi:hypothetical protein